ncbi:MAG: DUF3857 domain-containing protein [Planctomycetes bacterium]|nr:DUF3857 domain-containing protein [Planctomycetota bacterium]
MNEHVRMLLLFVLVGLGAVAQEPQDPASDAELRALIAAAGDARQHPGAGAVIVLDRTGVRVEPSGLAHFERRFVAKVLTEAGALAYARLRFDYDPMSNTVEVRSVRLLRAGGTVEDIALTTLVDLPQPQRGIYWGPRMKLVALGRLKPGDAVEYRVYTKGFMIAYLGPDEDDDERYIPPMRGHYYDVVAFAAREPTHRKHYTVETPRAMALQFEVYNGPVHSRVTVSEKASVHAFWLERVPAFKPEPRAPSLHDQVPKVVMATVLDWPTKSRWFHEVNEPQFAADAAIEAKVAELLEGKEDDRDRIAALVHWCANEIRYSGVNMGKGEGYTVHPSTMTFRDRCGVCKDKAGIAVTLLRVAGYTAYPALTMAGERVERIPADQFNHCVLALRMDDKVKVKPDPTLGYFTRNGRYWLLDPTWVVYSPELWSSAESEQHVVIGSPEGEELEITPLYPAEHSRVRIEGAATLKPQGEVEGAFTVTGTAYAEQRLRRWLAGTSALDWRARFEEWVGHLAPDAELLDFAADYAALRDVTTPIRYTVQYRLPGYWLAAGNEIRFAAPLSHHPPRETGLAPYWGMASRASRTQPLFLWSNRQVELSERIAVPAGYRVKHLPRPIVLDRPAASLRAEWRQEGDGLVFEATVQSRLRTVPAADYPGFKQVIDEVAALAAREIVLER